MQQSVRHRLFELVASLHSSLHTPSSNPDAYCRSCGSTIRATRDNKGLELCNPTPDFDRESESSNPFADIFGSERAARSTTADKGDSASAKRSNTVIDVDVEIKPADDDE